MLVALPWTNSAPDPSRKLLRVPQHCVGAAGHARSSRKQMQLEPPGHAGGVGKNSFLHDGTAACKGGLRGRASAGLVQVWRWLPGSKLPRHHHYFCPQSLRAATSGTASPSFIRGRNRPDLQQRISETLLMHLGGDPLPLGRPTTSPEMETK